MAAKRLTLAVGLIVLGLPPSQAQEIDWPATWKASDKAVYEITRCRKKTRITVLVDTCIKSSMRIEVLRAGPQGSRQLWTSSTSTDDLAGLGMGPAMESMLAKALNGKLDIEFDESAQPVRLLNAKEVRDALEGVYRSMAEQAARAGKDQQAIARGRALMSQMISTDQQLIALATKDVSILYAPLGGRYTIGKPLLGRSAVQTPFGGQMEADVTVTARTNSKSKGIEVQIDEVLDPERIRRLTEKLIDAADPASRPSASELKATTFDLRRSAVYQMRPGSNWPAQARWIQTMKSEGEEHVDSIEFKRMR